MDRVRRFTSSLMEIPTCRERNNGATGADGAIERARCPGLARAMNTRNRAVANNFHKSRSAGLVNIGSRMRATAADSFSCRIVSSRRTRARAHVPPIYWIITAGEMFSEESVSLTATTEYRCRDTEKRSDAMINVDYEYYCVVLHSERGSFHRFP